MVSLAKEKLSPLGGSSDVAAAEDLEEFAVRKIGQGEPLFDGAFSNFAPLNCVPDLSLVAFGLAKLLKPGAAAMLVLFGTFCPGEMITELLRLRPKNIFRRLQKGKAPARLGAQTFDVVYHSRSQLVRSFAPWFVLETRLGIGISVPPSAAEPWITQQPRLLAAMESADKFLSRPLACFGDHVLYQFRRTNTPATNRSVL
jgi:hypothetical protein